MGILVSRPQWSDLPQDLLPIICKCLNTRIDVLRLRAVCSSWRSSIPPVLPPPLKLPFPIPPNCAVDDISRGYFTVTESRVYLLVPLKKNPKSSTSSSKGFLVKVDEDEELDSVHLLKPLLKLLIKRCHQDFPKLLNLLDFRVSEFGRVYNVINYTFHNNGGSKPINVLRLPHISKVVVSSPNPVRTNSESYVVMAIYNSGSLCLLKAGNEEWTAIDEQHSDYTDVINYKGKFYAVNNGGRALEVDPFLKVTEIASPICDGYNHQIRLVESFGELLLVDRYLHVHRRTMTQFRVYKLDEEERKWVEVESLGDRVFFVGKECSFSISARDFTGCERNCIYYADEYLNTYKNDDSHMSVFKLKYARFPLVNFASPSIHF